MANHPLWSDDYWLLLMQLYQKKPVGVKSEYSHLVVETGHRVTYSAQNTIRADARA